MTFKQMDNLMMYLMNYYRYHQQFQISEPSVSDDCLIYLIYTTLETLNNEERLFVEKEYLNKKCSWWDEYYSRATYYRLKKQIMCKFLYFINQIK